LIAFLMYYFIHFWALAKALKIRDKQVRLLCMFPIMAILFLDVGCVSYSSKFTLYLLFSCASFIELKYYEQKNA